MNVRSLYWHIYLIGYILVGSMMILWVRMVTPRGALRKQRLHKMEKRWAASMFAASGSKLTVVYEAPLNNEDHYVFFANHQSSFDIFTLMAFTEVPAVFVSKPLYFKIPIFGRAMKDMGHFSIDRKNRRQALSDLARAQEAILAGKLSLIIFPEGTRSIDGTIRPFKTGPLRVLTPPRHTPNTATPDPSSSLTGVKTDVKIVPTALINTRSIQRKGSLRIYPAHVKLIFGAPIHVHSHMLTGSAKQPLMKKIETIVRTLYQTHAAPSKF